MNMSRSSSSGGRLQQQERLKRCASPSGSPFSDWSDVTMKRSRQLPGHEDFEPQSCVPLRRVQSAPASGADMGRYGLIWDDLQHWRSREGGSQPCPSQMQTVQSEVTLEMRNTLVDWLAEVRDEFRLHTETLFLAVAFLDRFLCIAPIPRVCFQLLGMTCMWVAAKFEEVYPPSLDAMLTMAENMYTSKDMREMERRLLFTLDFQLALPTALRQLHYFLQLAPLPEAPADSLSTRRLAEALLELALLDPALSAASPTAVAGAATYLALGLGRHLTGLQSVVALSGADPTHLGVLVKDLFNVLVRAQAQDREQLAEGGPRVALLSRYCAWEHLHARAPSQQQQQHQVLPVRVPHTRHKQPQPWPLQPAQPCHPAPALMRSASVVVPCGTAMQCC